jgi:predicted MFS family arabinose efflux permease
MAVTVISVTLARLVVNMTRRFPYPFIGGIARQLNVPLNSVQNLMAAQGGVGLSSPLFGPFSERYGRKRVMLACLFVMAVASGLAALVPGLWVFALVMVVFGLGKAVFDPAMQAYLGDRIPYRRRGLALGVTELSWALALIIIAPVAGFLLATSAAPPMTAAYLTVANIEPFPGLLSRSSGLQLVMLLLAVLCVAAFVLVAVFVPADRPDKDSESKIINPVKALNVIRKDPVALGAVAYIILLTGANEIFFINYSVWMESTFDLVLAALGAVTTIIAVSEVGGEVIIIALSDRLGKKRLALVGALISGVSYFLVPALATTLDSALVGLFIMFLAVEVAIVGSIPLFTEILPDARAIMMSGITAGGAGGRLLGAVIGGALLSISGDFVLIGAVATAAGISAFVVLLLLIPEGDDRS